MSTARSRVVDIFFARHDKTFEDSIVLGLGHDCYATVVHCETVKLRQNSPRANPRSPTGVHAMPCQGKTGAYV